jgi:multiple sugar transport system substrate-binding protein
MSHARTTRRVLAAAATIGAVLVTAACSSSTTPSASGGGASGSASAEDFSGKGPINYVQGKDTSGYIQSVIDKWNAQYPDQKVTLVELSDNADAQRQSMINNAQTKGGSNYDVLSVDVVWTAEFAANGMLAELPKDQLALDGFLPAAVDASTYFNKLYAMPSTSDGALLYYRKDLLTAAGIDKAPSTWDEMATDCKAVQAKNAGINCYGGQFQKYEGLTCNITEWVNSAGTTFLSADGKPQVNTPEAMKGVNALVGYFKDGTIPKEATTWQEEQSRQAFQDGKLVFLRNWPYVYSLASKTDGSSKVAGKFGVAPIPGLTGPGVSTLGGHNMGISEFSKNKGTALAFIKWWNSAENQKANLQKTSNAPTVVALYSDPELVKQFAYLPTLYDSIKNAQGRPKVVNYGDATLAIQDAAYAAIQYGVTGSGTDPQAAFDTLQTKLTSIIAG